MTGGARPEAQVCLSPKFLPFPWIIVPDGKGWASKDRQDMDRHLSKGATEQRLDSKDRRQGLGSLGYEAKRVD